MDQSAMLESDILDMSADTDLIAEVESVDVDVVDEMRLRTWARVNYRPAQNRDHSWHPVILDEMNRKDRELSC